MKMDIREDFRNQCFYHCADYTAYKSINRNNKRQQTNFDQKVIILLLTKISNTHSKRLRFLLLKFLYLTFWFPSFWCQYRWSRV